MLTKKDGVVSTIKSHIQLRQLFLSKFLSQVQVELNRRNRENKERKLTRKPKEWREKMNKLYVLVK